MLVLSPNSAAEGTEVPFQQVAGARVGPRAASSHPDVLRDPHWPLRLGEGDVGTAVRWAEMNKGS